MATFEHTFDAGKCSQPHVDIPWMFSESDGMREILRGMQESLNRLDIHLRDASMQQTDEFLPAHPAVKDCDTHTRASLCTSLSWSLYESANVFDRRLE